MSETIRLGRSLSRVDGKLEYLGKRLPPGPWHDEPDRVEFEHAGFACLLLRSGTGAWCGYVAAPPGHPWHGQQYGAVDASVHGGLTYSERCQGRICHVAKPGESDDVWWLGFDCNHHLDLSAYDLIKMGGAQSRIDHPEFGWVASYRTIDYARRQTELLAEQAKAVTK